LKLAIMQPYFFPYIGYWQLINYVNVFVVYDNIEYTKKGWINRNRYLMNGKPEYFSLPIEKGSDYLDIVERRVSDSYSDKKILHQLDAAYKKAPYYRETINLIERIYDISDRNLFVFLYDTIKSVVDYLDIDTEIVVSSTVSKDRALKKEKRVIDLCKSINADIYINPIGGMELYDKNDFLNEGIEIQFLKSQLPEYKQYQNEFVPALSIIDTLMFCGREGTKEMLSKFELVKP
jgi:hypothetical protein